MHVWHVRMKMCVWDDRCGGKGTYGLSDTGCSVKTCRKILLLDEGVDGGSMFGCFGEVSTDPYLVRFTWSLRLD